MKIIMINLGNHGSTGNIMLGIDKIARNRGHETYVCYPPSRMNKKKFIENEIIIGTRIGRKIHIFLSKMLGYHGMFSIIDTYLFLRKISRINPDVIHLHNIHGFYINLPMLFHYIKKKKIKVIWTLHDCWSFTGHCPYFSMIKCEKWKKGCHDCAQHRGYPGSYIDRSAYLWKKKRKWFTGVENMTLITPSKWLAEKVNKSFLKEYNTKVISNGIDLNVFQYQDSNLKKQWTKGKKQFIVLGVSFSWGKSKGLDVFVELGKRLGANYKIVLVGGDKKIYSNISNDIIKIEKTEDQKELAKIYSAADVFVNPTREEVFGMVNVEALACGTPIVIYNTGGCFEIPDEYSGKIVAKDNIEELINTIKNVCENKIFDSASCRKRALNYEYYKQLSKYVKLYEDM